MTARLVCIVLGHRWPRPAIRNGLVRVVTGGDVWEWERCQRCGLRQWRRTGVTL